MLGTTPVSVNVPRATADRSLGVMDTLDSLTYTVAEATGWALGVVGVCFVSVEWDAEPSAERYKVS